MGQIANVLVTRVPAAAESKPTGPRRRRRIIIGPIGLTIWDTLADNAIRCV